MGLSYDSASRDPRRLNSSSRFKHFKGERDYEPLMQPYDLTIFQT